MSDQLSIHAIMPAFREFRKEARVIGGLVAFYGELEFTLALCVGKALGNQQIGLRTLFGMRGEKARIRLANGLARDRFIQAGIGNEFKIGIDAIDGCREIRNQFAHAHWASSPATHDLYFTNLEDAAITDDFEYKWRHVDMPLLRKLEAYFYYAAECLWFLEHEYDFKSGTLQSHTFPMPTERGRPILHNPPSQHVPHWLSSEQKARHLELALAEERGDPTPTRAHKEMEAARAAKRARKQQS